MIHRMWNVQLTLSSRASKTVARAYSVWVLLSHWWIIDHSQRDVSVAATLRCCYTATSSTSEWRSPFSGALSRSRLRRLWVWQSRDWALRSEKRARAANEQHQVSRSEDDWEINGEVPVTVVIATEDKRLTAVTDKWAKERDSRTSPWEDNFMRKSLMIWAAQRVLERC